MEYKREDGFVLGFWNYNDFKTGGASEVARWKDLGLNVAMTPMGYNEADVETELPKLLDELQKNDMKAILLFHDVTDSYFRRYGEEAYRKAFTARYEKYGKHPAVLGFYPGEEPGPEAVEAYLGAIRVMKEVAPELTPFLEPGDTRKVPGLGKMIADTGVSVHGVASYSQMEQDERGIEEYFGHMHTTLSVCKEYGLDCWATMLSSSHYRFKAPDEAGFTWQINTAAALGCTGIFWFRIYDKLMAADYRESPIDEYGQPNGEHYRAMKRAQTRFNIHHGKLLMKMHIKDAFFIKRRYGGFPLFPEAGYGSVRRAYCPDTFFGCYDIEGIPGIVSFFEGDDGCEYIAVVNNTFDEPGAIILEFNKDVKKVEYIYHNGDKTMPLLLEGSSHLDYLKEEIWLAPGQMEILRVTK